jgi:uncharacterized protein YndB with AHSA1/START domain
MTLLKSQYKRSQKLTTRETVIQEGLNFRVGGGEIIRGSSPDGTVYTSVSKFQEIVPDNRIIYTLTVDMGETRILLLDSCPEKSLF